MKLNEEITIRLIEYNTDDYRNELLLRNEVLRKPLGMNLFDENLEVDKYDIHFAAFFGNRMVGVLLLKPLSSFVVKMRQVAVIESFQSKKTGTTLVRFAEVYAKNLGFTKMELHARNVAIGFYLKLGYQQYGEEFTEVGIPHIEMVKELG